VRDFHGQQYRQLATRVGKTKHQDGRMHNILCQLLVCNARHRRRRLGVDHVKRVSVFVNHHGKPAAGLGQSLFVSINVRCVLAQEQRELLVHVQRGGFSSGNLRRLHLSGSPDIRGILQHVFADVA